VADLLEHVVGQEGREGGCPLGPTTRAESPLLPTRRYQKLIAAVRASDTSEARLKSAAVKISVDDIVDEGSPETVALLEAFLPNALDLVVVGPDY
jgi:hypothetical protein